MRDRNFMVWVNIIPEMAEILLLILLFLWLLNTEGKPHIATCTRIDPFQMPYEYHKAGDLIIGAIITLFGFLLDEISFTENPSTITIDDVL